MSFAQKSIADHTAVAMIFSARIAVFEGVSPQMSQGAARGAHMFLEVGAAPRAMSVCVIALITAPSHIASVSDRVGNVGSCKLQEPAALHSF